MSLISNGQPTQLDTDLQTQTLTDPNGTQQVDWEKRYKDLQSYSDKTRVGYERQVTELREQSTQFVAPKTKEELEVFKQQNPDHYGTFETVADMMIQDRLAPLQQELLKSKQDAALVQLREAHPDFAQVVNSDHFKAWAESEGPEIQAWLNEETDASKPIRALNYYKAVATRDQAQTQQPQTMDHSAAQLVNLNSGNPTPTGTEGLRSYTRKQIESMNIAEYEANFETIQRSHAAGLITE